MSNKLTTLDAYNLFHEGALALSKVEANGIRIDMDYLNKTCTRIERKIAKLEQALKGDDIYKIWRKRYGAKTNIQSRQQLATILFEEMHFKPVGITKTGRAKMDEEALASINHAFVRDYLRIEGLKKTRGTFLEGIRREVVNGYIHAFINLHTAVSYRSSCDSPNLQNMPIRDKEQGEIIRRCFIARKGSRLVEIDFGGIEVRVAACYCKDPLLLQYVKDPTKDMHRDMASECFLLKREEVDKVTRYVGKNSFVFPQFYGSYYVDCSRNLWVAIKKMDLKRPDGVGLYEHLKAKGINRLGICDPESTPRPGTFEHHIKKVEEDFWGRRFKVYADWKNRWYNAYRSKGWFDTLTGFRVHGLFKRNEAINNPIQGVAFHCLLKTLIEIQKWLEDNKKRTKIVNEIHDSIIADVPDKEIGDYLDAAVRIATKELPKIWDWIIVPMEVEVSVSEIEGNWFERKVWTKQNGKWGPKE